MAHPIRKERLIWAGVTYPVADITLYVTGLRWGLDNKYEWHIEYKITVPNETDAENPTLIHRGNIRTKCECTNGWLEQRSKELEKDLLETYFKCEAPPPPPAPLTAEQKADLYAKEALKVIKDQNPLLSPLQIASIMQILSNNHVSSSIVSDDMQE